MHYLWENGKSFLACKPNSVSVTKALNHVWVSKDRSSLNVKLLQSQLQTIHQQTYAVGREHVELVQLLIILLPELWNPGPVHLGASCFCLEVAMLQSNIVPACPERTLVGYCALCESTASYSKSYHLIIKTCLVFFGYFHMCYFFLSYCTLKTLRASPNAPCVTRLHTVSRKGLSRVQWKYYLIIALVIIHNENIGR